MNRRFEGTAFLFEIQIFFFFFLHYSLNVFTITFDESLLNKIINIFKQKNF